MSETMTNLRADLERVKGRWRQIAADTDVGYDTVCRIGRGDTPAPQIDTYEKLRGWLDQHAPQQAA
jgi:hypothetical protein